MLQETDFIILLDTPSSPEEDLFARDEITPVISISSQGKRYIDLPMVSMRPSWNGSLSNWPVIDKGKSR